ncbi:1-acyl-sn-glycerol-3-phosphate acyltransferase [Hyphomicrobium sp. NDB2Meth4]|uniref:1-acyl-sn-glycerol-3-phosphate acyltransferase n=1 Tax=Hyphomicrobium sp. NDB2Meth4 TaxID=1892846 RepID=UPI000931C5C7|nr:1-acyl-sn-glycerol-3-phosphate acyltransferase [Hyphomicrobium sp. NDB2Meth4]
MQFPELSYANPDDPPLKRGLIRTLERVAGRDYFAPIYQRWRTETLSQTGSQVIRPMLDMLGIDLRIIARQWPIEVDPTHPLVIVANHPFGIVDGLAALALAEDLRRPFKVLINRELLKVPELEPYSLPIDFRETEEAIARNLATRREAIRLLGEGTTIVVFPAGGVATAARPFGRAEELPWKLFTARLVQGARAAVLPVYFEGQCSPLFHLASRISMTLRLSLLIREFRRAVGTRLTAHVGDVVPFDELEHRSDRRALIAELYQRVHALALPEKWEPVFR